MRGYISKWLSDRVKELTSWKIRLIEYNAKCRRLNKLTCKRTLREVFICLRHRTLYPLPPYTLYTYIQYSYSLREGVEEGRVFLTREKVRGATVHRAGSKIPTWLTVSPVCKRDKHLLQSPFTGKFLLKTTLYCDVFLALKRQRAKKRWFFNGGLFSFSI